MRGYEVLTAASGREGLEVASRRCPHLILLDINLPDMSGYAVAEALRSIPQHATTPIIAVTANALVSDRLSSIKAGCDQYLSKPINIHHLCAVIEESLQLNPFQLI